jgi:hypothetical protein
MTPAAFERSLSNAAPPKALEPALQALWWAKKGDWDKAHRLVMDERSREAAWVHAYLHRVEGDEGNAGYWYRQAQRRPAAGALDAEWAAIVAALTMPTPGVPRKPFSVMKNLPIDGSARGRRYRRPRGH